MKHSIFLITLYIFFLTFSLLSLFFGKTGITSLEKIRTRNQLLSGNLSLLDSKQENLRAKLADLRSNPESIVIGARALGLYKTDERVVHFRNLNPIHSLPDAGGVLYLFPLHQTDESLLRFFSAASGFIFFLASSVIWKLRNAVQKK